MGLHSESWSYRQQLVIPRLVYFMEVNQCLLGICSVSGTGIPLKDRGIEVGVKNVGEQNHQG